MNVTELSAARLPSREITQVEPPVLRARLTYEQLMQESYANMAVRLKDMDFIPPARLMHNLSGPLIDYWARHFQPLLRPTMSLQAAAGVHLQDFALTLRAQNGIKYRRVVPESIAERALTKFVSDQDYMFKQPMSEVIQQTVTDFGNRFLPNWNAEKIPTSDPNRTRWQTEARVYLATPLDRLNHRPQHDYKTRPWPISNPVPFNVDLTVGRVRDIMEFLQVIFSVPYNLDGGEIVICEIFGSQYPLTPVQKAADKRWRGSGVTRWGGAMGELLFDPADGAYFDLMEPAAALYEPNCFPPEFFSSENGAFQWQEAMRALQQAAVLWNVPQNGRTFTGQIDRAAPPFDVDNFLAAGEVVGSLELPVEQLGFYDKLDPQNRLPFLFAIAPEITAHWGRHLNLFKHCPNLSHITPNQWQHIEENLDPCTEQLAGKPEHRYWIASHSHPRTYVRPTDNMGFGLPSDFKHGWVTFTEAVQMFGDIPYPARKMPPEQFINRVFGMS